jgi:hypothetical protein
MSDDKTNAVIADKMREAVLESEEAISAEGRSIDEAEALEVVADERLEALIRRVVAEELDRRGLGPVSDAPDDPA